MPAKVPTYSNTSEVISQSRTRVKLDRVCFTADSSKPVPLAVVLLENTWVQWEFRQNIHATDNGVFGTKKKVTVTPAVLPALVITLTVTALD